jgi:hypothetical protein
MNYDEDCDDPRQRCRHGNFIGSWWGPDYLCGDCEFGYDPSLNDMLKFWHDHLRDIDKGRRYVEDFIRRLVNAQDEIDPDSKGTIAQCYMDSLNQYAKSKEYAMNECQRLVDQYADLCDPELGYDDTEILYNYHRKEVNEYLAERGQYN